MTPTTQLLDAPHEIVDDATRRQFLVGGAGLAAALLAGCGSTGSSTSGGAATKPFEHLLGTTEVPVAPQRIVALGATYFAWPLATLGVLPIGAAVASADDPVADIRLADPEAASKLDGMVSVDGGGEPDLERIAALRPDLIIGRDGDHDAIYERLSAIAPTVVIGDEAPTDRYFPVQRRLAELTGTFAMLERLHDEYEARVAAVRETFRDDWADLEWISFDDIGDGANVTLTNLAGNGTADRVLADLGARLAPSAERFPSDDSGFATISRERLPDLDADVIFVTPAYQSLVDDPDTPVDPDTLTLLGDSRAARVDQVLRVGLAWTNNAGITTLNLVLDDLERLAADRPGGFFTT